MSEESTALVKVEDLNAVDLYTGDAIDDLLKKIKDEVSSFVPDLSTDKGRKAIASLARKVASSKVVIDGLGKDLTQEWKDKSKLVDVSRKMARDYLDALRDETRKPLTDWEDEEKAKKAAIRMAEETKIREEHAAKQAEQLKKDQELADREAEIKRQEDAAKAKDAEAKRQADAEERAKVAAEESIKAEREANARRIIQEQMKAEQANRDRIASEERCKVEQAQAVQKAKDDARANADRKEAERLAEVAKLQNIEDARKANEDNRREVNQAALSGIMKHVEGISEDMAKDVIRAIVTNRISNVTINY